MTVKVDYVWTAEGEVIDSLKNVSVREVKAHMGLGEAFAEHLDTPEVKAFREAERVFSEALDALSEVGQIAELAEDARDTLGPVGVELMEELDMPIRTLNRVTVVSV